MKIVLLGKDGQVGWELQRALAPLGNLAAFGRAEADLEDVGALIEKLRAIGPQVIVNAAAYTAVDKAESEPERAARINALAPGALAGLCAELGAWLVHYSTDYVFAGQGTAPYVETDATGPLSVYGKTKLGGEQAIVASACRHLIFRTSWVYAARGGNFAKTMLRLAAERDQLTVVGDQFGAPTSAELIADVTALCLHRVLGREIAASGVSGVSGGNAGSAASGVRGVRGVEASVAASRDEVRTLSGIYHLVAKGETSWYDYACHVIAGAARRGAKLRLDAAGVRPIPTHAYPLPAPRPANSRLSVHKLEATFGLVMPDWRFHVDRLLDEIV